MKTPLEQAIAKRDRALAKHERLTQKAERAREQWIKWSAEVAVLQRVIPMPKPEATKPGPLMVADPMRGVCAAVANRLGLSHEHVRQVAYGKRVSARVLEALQREQALRSVGGAA